MPRGERAWEGRIVVAHVTRGPSLKGVLIACHRDAWELGSVTNMDAEADIAGRVLVARSNSYLQAPEDL